jgi:hypothetical protein
MRVGLLFAAHSGTNNNNKYLRIAANTYFSKDRLSEIRLTDDNDGPQHSLPDFQQITLNVHQLERVIHLPGSDPDVLPLDQFLDKGDTCRGKKVSITSFREFGEHFPVIAYHPTRRA